MPYQPPTDDQLREAAVAILRRSIYCPGCGAKLAFQTPGVPRHSHLSCPELLKWLRLDWPLAEVKLNSSPQP